MHPFQLGAAKYVLYGILYSVGGQPFGKEGQAFGPVSPYTELDRSPEKCTGLQLKQI